MADDNMNVKVKCAQCQKRQTSFGSIVEQQRKQENYHTSKHEAYDMMIFVENCTNKSGS